MGRSLQSLREQGVLVIGSGSMTHNLAEFFGGPPGEVSEPAPYVLEFSRRVESAVERVSRLPLTLSYAEYPGGHAIMAAELDAAMNWLRAIAA